MTVDYKDTVRLPKTDFPMRGNLPEKEPEILAYWQQLDLYNSLRRQSKGRTKFVLHYGPPFANGDMHIGHALSKTLKDVVVRTHQMSGYDAPLVPGWDCHGLPIEWKIEEKYRAAGQDKDTVPVLIFREECRQYARHSMEKQIQQQRRLGVLADWEHPYSTMHNASEATIVQEIHKFLLNGGLYRGSKPVMWSVVEKTALAEAEIEYHEHKSICAWVAFPVLQAGIDALKNASVVIWTTTPWTLPANRAIAYGDFEYAVLTVDDVAEESLARKGAVLVVAQNLLAAFVQTAKITAHRVLSVVKGAALAGTIAAHPLRGQGYDFDVPLLMGDFVTTDTGTGFVHIAPSHGMDDYHLGRTHGLPVPDMLYDDGRYQDHVPLFAGKRVYMADGKPGDANGAVLAKMIEVGALLAKESLRHSYPHSWRSKAPVIFRTTPQWFIAMEHNSLRDKALIAIDNVRWVPPKGRNRIHSMIENRPDWCISRQRVWGVPIAIFVEKSSGDILKDPTVLDRIYQAFCEEGADAWYSRDPASFLGDAYNAADYEQVFDVVDVWFESGSTHSFVLEKRPELAWPADLYLEGSDQHRGWFHSSLLEAVGTRGTAPYKQVLTHGFVLDQNGRKMSKSLGNGIDPQDMIAKYGADVVRLWALSAEFTEDVLIGPDIFKNTSEVYRRLRNTLRYLLGAIDGFDAQKAVDYQAMPALEQYILGRLADLDQRLQADIKNFDYNAYVASLHHFCTTELSALYFDIRKDSLYCDDQNSQRRLAAQTVMHHLFNHLVRWLAPVLVFTAEEAWLASPYKNTGPSVHMADFLVTPEAWRNPALLEQWQAVLKTRAVITAALEEKRAAKLIGSSLEAHVTLVVHDAALREVLLSLPMAELCIVSTLTIVAGGADNTSEGIAVDVARSTHEKCERCWQHLPDVGQDHRHASLCGRCADVVETWPVLAAE